MTTHRLARLEPPTFPDFDAAARLVAAMLLIGVGFGSTPARAADPLYQNQIKTARRTLSRGQFQPAADLFEKILKSHPLDEPAATGLAEAWIGLERYADADTLIAGALTRVPGKADLYKLRVRLRRAQDRPAEAFEDLVNVLDADAERAPWAFRETRDLLTAGLDPKRALKSRGRGSGRSSRRRSLRGAGRSRAQPGRPRGGRASRTSRRRRGAEAPRQGVASLRRSDARAPARRGRGGRASERGRSHRRGRPAIRRSLQGGRDPGGARAVQRGAGRSQAHRRRASRNLLRGQGAPGQRGHLPEVHERSRRERWPSTGRSRTIRSSVIAGPRCSCRWRIATCGWTIWTMRPRPTPRSSRRRWIRSTRRRRPTSWPRSSSSAATSTRRWCSTRTWRRTYPRSLLADDAAGRYILLNKHLLVGGGVAVQLLGRMEWGLLAGDSAAVDSSASLLIENWSGGELAAEAYLGLADLAERSGRYPEAIEHLQKIVTDHRGRPARAGRAQAARRHLRPASEPAQGGARALRDDPHRLPEQRGGGRSPSTRGEPAP